MILLGPQRLDPDLGDAFDRLGIHGQVAAVTAGWQEREGEDEELRSHLQRTVVDLQLHARLEQVFGEDKELFGYHRARQDRLKALQQLYRYRLDFVIEPARELLRREGDPELIQPQQEEALDALRRLDAEHLAKIAEVHAAFDAEHRPTERPSVRRHRRELASILESSKALAIAGGNVAVLLNRMRLFGLADLIGDKPIFAWSAGAMALAERIVLFHDSPPQGAGNAEVLDIGLGLAPGVVPLPHASQRLKLDDPCRVALFVRRFAPGLCAVLDPGARLSLQDGDRWIPLDTCQRLCASGKVVPVEAS